MKQIIQNYKTGELQLAEVPAAVLRSNGVLLKTKSSLISAGTEKLMLSMAKKGYLGKAIARPDLVKQIINKIKVDGLADAYQAAMSRMDAPVTLGYSSAGKIMEVGAGAAGFRKDDRIACFGDGFATHSEYSYIPINMFVKIPDQVSYEEAAFAGLGAIALNAIRVANLTFGETVAVIGLGLLGQLTVQMLKAFGCQVIGIDIDGSKTKMAEGFGCDRVAVVGKDDINQVVQDYTKGVGADSVIIMADSKDNRPVEMAAEISREKGRIVACGMIKIDVPRQEFFKKELSVIVSRATGPGKFDPKYENHGIDYPLPFVRWTTQRNMAYFLELVGSGKIKLEKLISHRFKLDAALQAYEMILKGTEKYCGILIEYDQPENSVSKVNLFSQNRHFDRKPEERAIGIGIIGAGLHTNTSLLPVLSKNREIKLIGIADIEGHKSRHSGEKYKFNYCVSDYKELLADKRINTILIATRHNLHAKMVLEALQAGKDVFVEKPLCMNLSELEEITQAFKSSEKRLLVGFNRRFAPSSAIARKYIGNSTNIIVNCRVNAGYVNKDSWVHDVAEGGGRIIGEVCHFIDLMQYLTSSLVIRVYAESTAEKGEDNLVVTLRHANGSVSNIVYSSQGDKLLPRERIEVFCGNSVIVMDNFKSIFYAKNGRSNKTNKFNIDRGYKNEFDVFFGSIRAGTPGPVLFDEYVNTSLTSFAIIESLKANHPVEVKTAF